MPKGMGHGAWGMEHGVKMKNIYNYKNIEIIVVGGVFWIRGCFGWDFYKKVYKNARSGAQGVKNSSRRHRE